MRNDTTEGTRRLSLGDLLRLLVASLRVMGPGKGPLLLCTQSALALILLPSILQGLLGGSLPLQLLAFMAGMAIVPAVMLGLFQRFAEDAKGLPVQPPLLLSVFRDGPLWRQAVLLHALNVGAMLVLVGAGLSAVLDEAYLQALLSAMQSANSATPASLPDLPQGAALGIVLLCIIAIWLHCVQYLSLARLSKHGESAWSVWTWALRAVLTHALPLLLISLLAIAGVALSLVVFTLLIALPVQALSALNGALGSVVMLLLYFAFAVVMTALLCAFFLRLHDALSAAAPSEDAGDRIAL